MTLPTAEKAQAMYLTIVADAIKEIDTWQPGKLTAVAFIDRLGEILETSIREDFEGLESFEGPVRKLHDSLLRSFDLLRDPKAPPRGTIH